MEALRWQPHRLLGPGSLRGFDDTLRNSVTNRHEAKRADSSFHRVRAERQAQIPSIPSPESPFVPASLLPSSTCAHFTMVRKYLPRSQVLQPLNIRLKFRPRLKRCINLIRPSCCCTGSILSLALAPFLPSVEDTSNTVSTMVPRCCLTNKLKLQCLASPTFRVQAASAY
jgi:hypothetical protein